ncbi:Helix-turn-helix domain-containing protein [Lentzea albida]|uniref:Helix-turn-helix domain-containing protein n=2 Tax=Lentzea albida TaxID=65499 RepID=A0A1H9U8Y7_9PSEU|nr:Helix-turn-helix domain-containing protein [Lentzea albida]
MVEFCTSRVVVDPALAATASLLRTGDVASAAWEIGLSSRQLRRRCLDAFGYPPKVLQRVLRFDSALKLAWSGLPFASVAADAGYADQAHLAREVKALAGVPLSQLIRP